MSIDPALEKRFEKLENEDVALYDLIYATREELRSDIARLQSDVTEIRSDITEIRSDVSELRTNVTEILRRLPEAPPS